MTLTIPKFSIRINGDGSVDGDPIEVLVRFDVCPSWMQIAQRHLDSALIAQSTRIEAWGGPNEDAKGQAIEAEFEASMQAIMAAVIAWDAVYAIVREHVEIPPETREKWRVGRTPRYAQVCETVRQAFNLPEKGAARLRDALKQMYTYRDMAVHPSGKIDKPMHHPELDVGMEWRFVYFRASNAEVIVKATAGMLWELATVAKAEDVKLIKYQETLATRLREIYPSGPPPLPSRAGASDA